MLSNEKLDSWQAAAQDGSSPTLWAKEAVLALPLAVNAWLIGVDVAKDTLPRLLRLLRNAPAIGGPGAAAALIECSMPEQLANAVHALLSLPSASSASTPTQPEPESDQSVSAPQLCAPVRSSESAQLPCMLIAQALANLCQSGEAGCESVWAACWPRTWMELLQHPSRKVSEPATAALHACIRPHAASHTQSAPTGGGEQGETTEAVEGLGDGVVRDAKRWDSAQSRRRALQLCALPGCAPIWAALMANAAPNVASSLAAVTIDDSSRANTVTTQASASETRWSSDDGSEWIPLLVGKLAFSHALMPQLLACAAAASGSTGPGGDASGSSGRCAADAGGGGGGGGGGGAGEVSPAVGLPWGPYTPVMLHLIAHEAQHMPNAPILPQSDLQQPEVAAAQAAHVACLGCLVHTLLSAAEVTEQDQAITSNSATPSTARTHTTPSPSTVSSSITTHSASTATAGASPSYEPCASLSRHVLEACLQALRCIAQRDYRGAGLSGGTDPLPPLCSPPYDLALHLLRMLAALPPPKKPRDNAACMAQASAPNTVPTSSTSAQGGQGAGGSAATRPAPAVTPQLPHLAQRLPGAAPVPTTPPYLGYRGDVLAVLANAMFGRPEAAEQVAEQELAVELVLSQCALDDTAPLAREWALWAVRNLCAGSERARNTAAALQPVGSVETPELSKLGLKLELDAVSGKMNVVKTDKTKE